MAVLKCRKTPIDVLEGWRLFTSFYLDRLPGGKRLPPHFFYQLRLPTPDFHEQMILDLGSESFIVVGAPRSSAKTTLLQSCVLQDLCTGRRNFRQLVVCSTDKMVRMWLNIIKIQLSYNENIIEDFGVLRPQRGDGPWGSESLMTTQFTHLAGMSVGSRMLGYRPNRLILDDPEYDPDATTHGTKDVKKMGNELEALLFNTIMPMLDVGQSPEFQDEPLPTLFWIGTLIHRGAFIYHALKTTTDTRFTKHWKRQLRMIAEPDDSGVMDLNEQKGRLLWPAKWPWDRIDELRSQLGEARFRSSYMNDPAADCDLLLKIDDKYHKYWIEGPHPAAVEDPLRCGSTWSYWKRTRTQGGRYTDEYVSEPTGDIVSRMWRILTVDYASTATSRSDYSGVLVQGFDNKGTLWALDLWLGKVSQAELVDNMWRLGLKWRVHVCGIESVGLQKQIVERARLDLQDIVMKTGWKPRVVPIDYRGAGAGRSLEKGDRIAAALEWRFAQYLVKLPADLEQMDSWKMLYHQIRNFSPDLHLLTHDDAIDMLAMHGWLKGKRYGVGRGKEPVAVLKTAVENLALGIAKSKDGLPYFESINASELTEDAEAGLVRAQERELEDEEEVIFWKP